MSKPSSFSPDSQNVGWDPFSDDLVTPLPRNETKRTPEKVAKDAVDTEGVNVKNSESVPPPEDAGDEEIRRPKDVTRENGERSENKNDAERTVRGDGTDGNETYGWDADTPIAVPNPQRAARMETDPEERLVPSRKPTVIVPEAPQILDFEVRKRTDGAIPTRPTSLPEERLIRPPARMPVPPPASDRDIYAIREDPEPVSQESISQESISQESVSRGTVSRGTVSQGAISQGAVSQRAVSRGANDVTRAGSRQETAADEIPHHSTKPNDPWKTIFDEDDVPAAWRRSNGDTKPTQTRSEPKMRGTTPGQTTESRPATPVSSVPVSPGQRLQEAAARRQLEQLEANAQRRLQEEEERIRDANLSTWEFFRQGAVLGRMGVVSLFGILLSGLQSLSFDDTRFEGLFTLAIAFAGGGVLLMFFLSLLLQSALDTFELSFARSERVHEWPVSSGLVDGILAIRYPIVAIMTASFAVIFVEIILLVFSYVWMLIPGVAGELTVSQILRGCTVVAAPLTLFLVFPLCYMTALANNDVFDTIPVAVWTARRTILKPLGRFYLEQLLIFVALLVGGGLVGLLHEPAPMLYHILAIGWTPLWMVFLCLLWHERLGRFAAACAEAERGR